MNLYHRICGKNQKLKNIIKSRSFITYSMRVVEELEKLGIYKCPECNCAVGEDWEYKDFSNHNIVICPQCKTEIRCD